MSVARGDARRLPLAADSVDLIVTSPPYFSLRSYRDDGEHYDGQIGSEARPSEFVAALVECMTEWRRVLKPSGSVWVNLGDKYAESGGAGTTSGLESTPQQDRGSPKRYTQESEGIRGKSLMGLPWRFAIACIDDGWILRAEVVWCLSGGTRVYAEVNGRPTVVMVRDLYRSYRPETVRLWNGERWTQVLGWSETPRPDDPIELVLRNGEWLTCTPNHEWPTNRGLLRADAIRPGDVIDSTRLPEPGSPVRPGGLDDDDIGWLVGLYLAEGSRSERTLQFAGHIDETARHARLRRIADHYHGTASVYQTSEHGATCNLTGPVLVSIIDRYVSGGSAASKRLLRTCWERSDRFIAAVAEGYLEGDGHYDAKNDRWRLGLTRNEGLAADLRTLGARLGASVRLTKSSVAYDGRRVPTYRGQWRWAPSDHPNTRSDTEVVRIQRGRARRFYDIGVADEPHTFALASGVLTHNSKPNGMPESVTDRVRRSHETWFMFTKERRYFAAVDEIREPHGDWVEKRTAAHRAAAGRSYREGDAIEGSGMRPHTFRLDQMAHPLGRLPGSVWEIPTAPLIVPDAVREARNLPSHFAAFPQEWPRRIIQGWSPTGWCDDCGQPIRPDVERTPMGWSASPTIAGRAAPGTSRRTASGTMTEPPSASIVGYVCTPDCPRTTTIPAVVLDPFGGTGTTAGVARALGRTGISIDLSHDYSRLAHWRIHESGHFAASEEQMWADRQGVLL